ncbi:lipopolysaccharide biosynthesis protein [Solimonas soli]|uniref:lipopolysaccharide biosynthesis protein n=1 Tax=Solimonas soli TaxID=413479 RepID=UPI00048671BB|nr:hypothetical protein [Solimonas soli]
MNATRTQAVTGALGADTQHKTADTVFRAIGVALQIAATLAIARTLSRFDTGLFFEGFVVTLAGAAFMRAKFDVYMGRYIVANLGERTGIANADMLRTLSVRFMKRCCLICALLLVVAADLDVMSQNLHPYLQTFIPFVLALPLAGYAQMIGGALRAANRYLMSLICSAYAMNAAILIAVALAPPNPPLALFSWIFFGGSLLGALVAHRFARLVFGAPSAPAPQDEAQRAAWTTIDNEINSGASVGFSNATMLWGPLCLLVVLAPATQMALFAISTRTAQIILYLIPVIALIVAPRLLRQRQQYSGELRRAELWLAMSGLTLVAGIMAAALIASSAWTLDQYGPAYRDAIAVYIALIVSETLATIGRPLVRFHAANWNAGDARHILSAAALVAVVATLALVPWFDAFGAAIGLAAGHATAVALGLWSAMRRPPQPPQAAGAY